MTPISNPSTKSAICRGIFADLPAWFGIPESTAMYVDGVQDKPFFAAYIDGEAVGFVSLAIHNKYTAEIYVMGIKPTHHRHGLGRQLVAACEQYCIEHHMEFLTVKTLDEKNPDEGYRKTRLFYEAMGFRPLEVFPTLWDEANPCLFLAKWLQK